MDGATIDRYLERIGAERPARADADALRHLQHRHLLAVPFENLSIHLGEPIVLTEDALVAKIVDGRRGGFCYELNGLFGMLLDALGYRGTLLAARHALRIAAADDGDLDVLRDRSPQFRAETRPRALADCEPTCWWQQTSPASHFTQSTVCSLLTDDGRVTLSGNLLIRTAGGQRHEDVLPSDAAVLDAYRRYFGIELDRVPTLEAAEVGNPFSCYTPWENGS